MITDRTIADQVTVTLDDVEQADNFDIEAIVDTIISGYGLVDINTIDQDDFWDIVLAHGTWE